MRRPGLLERMKSTAIDAEEGISARADEILACLTVATIVVASFWRLRFGVDFTDEAFYAAITQRYALGDVPYLDEYNLRQTASLLTVPYYWLYLKVNGGTDGVVYFLRVIYFLVQLGTGWTVYRFAEKRLPRSFAMIAASLPVVFIPFGIPTCSYNTLGAMFFAAGAFTGLRALFDDPRPHTFTSAGVLHGLACVAYPPLAVPVLVFAAMTRFAREDDGADATARDDGADATARDEGDDGDLEDDDDLDDEDDEARRRRWAPFWRYMLGLTAVGLLLAALLLPGLLNHGVSQALTYESMTTQVRTIDKARDVITSALSTSAPGGSGWFATLGVCGLIAKQHERLRKYVLAGVVLWIASYFQDVQAAYTANVNSVYLSIYLGLLAGFFLLLVDWKRGGRVLMLAGWIPSVVAGFIMGFSTSNVGCVNGGMGLFAAACLAMIAAPLAAQVASLSQLGRVLGVLVMSAIPLSTLSINLRTTYRSGEVSTLTAKVTTGPYKGIWSAPSTALGAEDLTRDVRATLGDAKRMLVYYDFPAPYLAAPVRPAMPTVWTDSRAKIGVLLPYYQAHRTGDGIAFVLTGMSSFCPELEAIVQKPERLLKDNGWYRIYREPPP
ncbi:MAG: hypothetical protein KF795_10075 [Labilithrix sp.]|nr:hypothetical protein [Labilithrix sp.]